MMSEAKHWSGYDARTSKAAEAILGRELWGLCNMADEAIRLTDSGELDSGSELALSIDGVENLYPDVDGWEIGDCAEWIRDNMTAADMPEGSDPWAMDRADIVAELEGVYGCACYDDESDGDLAEALAENRLDVDGWRDIVRDNAEPAEVLQWFIVSDRLYHWLRNAGEVVAIWGSLHLWGRQTCGQAIIADGIMQRIVDAEGLHHWAE